MGIPLVERSKTGSAYVPIMDSDEASYDLSNKTKKRKKAKKVDVRDILSNQNKSRDDMRKAIVDLTGSVRNKYLSNDELMFKKEIWLDKKEFFIKKLQAKYAPQEKRIRLEMDKTKIEFVKADRDLALERMNETKDEDMKAIHKEEYVSLSRLHSSLLLKFVSPSVNVDEPTTPVKSHDSSFFPDHDDEIVTRKVTRSAD